MDGTGLQSSAYWRQRAERARLCAAEMVSDEVRATLLDIAIVYDSMAERAARREMGPGAKNRSAAPGAAN